MVPICINTFERKICLVETKDLASLTSELADDSYQSVFFCNVHMLMLSQEDQVLAKAMDNADLIFADGVPVAWLQRRLSGKEAKVIRGYEIMLSVCEYAAERGEKVGFLGSTKDVMNGLVVNLCKQFDGLAVEYQYCPPYMDGELVSSPKELQTLRASDIKWLFVGLGCPKQEKWIARYKNELACNVMGVGAAFDWLSGMTSKPPAWMERFALGWLYRLSNNPIKMWRRYLIYNTKFIIKTTKVLLGVNQSSSNTE